MIGESTIKTAYDVMQSNRLSLYDAAEHELETREALKDAEAEADLSGKCDGKNAEVRAAQKKEITKQETEALRTAEKEKRAAQISYELSCMQVDCIKWLIRAEEVNQGEHKT